VRILSVTVRRQSEAHSVSFGTDVYIVSHIGIWERLAREPWLFEEVEAGAWTGGGAKSQTLSFAPPAIVPWYVLILIPCSKRRLYHLQLVLV
jgi:hypothetical protein